MKIKSNFAYFDRQLLDTGYFHINIALIIKQLQ